MPRQLNARLLHHKMEKLREKGKDGEYVSDGTVKRPQIRKTGGRHLRSPSRDEQGHRQA